MSFFLIPLALAGAPGGAGHDIPITPAGPEPARVGPTPSEPGDSAAESTGEPPAAPASGTDGGAPLSGPPAAPAEGTPAPVDPAPSTPLEDEDDPVAPPVDSITLTPEEKRAEAATLYVKGLDAWKSGKHTRAWRLASEALALDPDLTPARLLAGYALLRMRHVSEGVTTLHGLELEPDVSPLPDDARRAAHRIIRRHEVPYRRDQWWLSVGNITFLERLGDSVVPLNGYVFAGQVPLLDKLSLRVDGGSPWANGGDLDVRGPRFDLMAVVTEPVDRGLWQVDVAAGPAFWAASGRYWADGWEPYFGVRAALGVDVRLGTTIGLRYEMGFSAFPTAAEDLDFYAEPIDFRLALQTWFGK